MEIKVTGTLPIIADVQTEESLHDFVEKAFADLMNVSDGIVFISGHINEDKLDVVGEFLIKIHSIIDFSETHRVKIKGDLSGHLGEYVLDEDGIILNYFDGTNETSSEEIYTAQ